MNMEHRGLDWELTPGEIARKVNPCSAKDWAYCTVNMFKAALETLYAGTGNRA